MMSGPETISTLNDEVKDEEATIPLELQEIKDLKNLRSEEFTPLNIQELTGRIDGILWESVIKNAEAEPILGRFEELKGHIKYYFSDKASTEETISVLEHVSEFFRIGIGTNEKISDKIGIFLREESPKLLEGCEKRGTRYKYELFRTYCFVDPILIPDEVVHKFAETESELREYMVGDTNISERINRKKTGNRTFEDCVDFTMYEEFTNLYQRTLGLLTPAEYETQVGEKLLRLHNLFPNIDTYMTGYSSFLDMRYYKLIHGERFGKLFSREEQLQLFYSWASNVGRKTSARPYFGASYIQENIGIIEKLEAAGSGILKTLMGPPFNIRNFGRYSYSDLKRLYDERDAHGEFILVVTPDVDFNGVFYGKNNFGELVESASNVGLKVRFAEINRSTGRKNSLSRLHKELFDRYGGGSIVCGVLSGHGDIEKQEIQLGGPFIKNSTLSAENFEHSKRPQLIRDCYSKDALIFVNSCGLGADKDNSFAKFVSSVTGLRTFGSSETIIPLYLKVVAKTEGGYAFDYQYRKDSQTAASVNTYLGSQRIHEE